MVNQNNSTLAFVAGRSGGHILPALALAQQHKSDHPHDTIIFFSTNTALDRQLLSTAPTVDHHIPFSLDNVPNKLWRYPRFMWQLIRSLCTSFRYLYKYKPSRVISTGGYSALPVCFAAKLLRIPVTLYELNAVPGKAAKMLAPYAQEVLICFADAARYFPSNTCKQVPYPLRFTTTDNSLTQDQALQQIGFDTAKKTLFILGGSQGSVFINDWVKGYIESNQADTSLLQVIHQTGAQDSTDWKSFYAQHNIPALIFAYHDKVQQFYAASDLIICRSGAGTLWEIAFFNKRAITIPLETATTDHQVDNARAIAAERPDLFTVITQKDIAHNRDLCYKKVSDCLQMGKDAI